jgi:hypothetical protein
VSPPGASMMMKLHFSDRRLRLSSKCFDSSASAASRSRAWLASMRAISGMGSGAPVLRIQRERFSR